MAGGDIYLSEMLKSLNANIDALKTDMATMSGDMGTMVSELVALKTTMGQGISSVNVEIGSENSVILNDTELSLASSTITKKITFLCKCSGKISFAGEIKTSSAVAGNLFYSINAGANVSIASTSSTSYTAVTKDIVVKDGDVIDILMQSAGPSYTLFLNAGSVIQYNLVDIVNDGAVIV